MKSNTSLVLSLAYCLVGISLQSLPTSAQITPDGTTSTTVNVNGNNFEINQGDRLGDNLFHSFNEFSIPTLGSAAFNNANNIANIFSRVTGSNISNIDGLISANGTANLFLINPNGIIFGENASLNLGGSFLASTADSLLFEDNLEFSAVNPQAPPLLKVNMPIGLNLGNNPGEIVNRSYVQNSAGDFVGLEVAPGENLTLVGGNINFERGQATARGGNIELGGLSAAGTVGINDDGSLSFPEDVAQADITLSNAADVDVRGTGGGSIIINAGNLNLEAGDFGRSRIRAGITADSTSANAQAGDININATDNVAVNDSVISNRVASEAVGNAGGVTLTTGSLTLTNGGRVSASTWGEGNAGLVEITASDTITIDGEGSQGFPSGATSQVGPDAEGDAGGVTIDTGSLSLNNGGLVSASTFGEGNAGSINVNAPQTVFLTDNGKLTVETSSSGKPGDIIITTPHLTIGKDAEISATATETSTNSEGGGSITVNASNLDLTGKLGIFAETQGKAPAGTLNIQPDNNKPNLDIQFTDTAIISASTTASGTGGDINLTAPETINITGQGKVAVETRGTGDAGRINITTEDFNISNQTEISASTSSSGQAGDIKITANNFNLTEGATVITNTASSGQAGDIQLEISDNLNLVNSTIAASTAKNSTGNGGSIFIDPQKVTLTNSQIAVRSEGQGTDGNIDLQAGSLTLDQSTITAETASNQGGNINLTLSDLLTLRNNSQITATAGTAQAEGDGGNINIDAPFILSFPDENKITAKAFLGKGGNINIITNSIFGREFLEIDASSQFGLEGTVSINTLELDPSQGLLELPSKVETPQILQGCETSRGGGSSFISTGRGGLPPSPTETLSSREVWKDVQLPTQLIKNSANTVKYSNTTPERIVEATGWIINEEGIVEQIEVRDKYFSYTPHPNPYPLYYPAKQS